MQNKNKELDRLNGVYMKLLNNAGVEYIEGRGSIVDAHTVDVDGKKYTVSAPAVYNDWPGHDELLGLGLH